MGAVVNENKARFFEGVAAVASTLGSPARLKILYVLAQAPRSVEAVAGITGESVANTSQHLRRLLGEGMVKAKREKLSRFYSLNDESIAFLIENLFDLAEKVSPVVARSERDLIEGDTGKPADLSAARQGLLSKKAVMLDVRDAYEASASPVAGAVSLPLETMKKEGRKVKRSLSRKKTYYVFCRGRSCERATEGVRLLRSMGFNAFRLKESPASIGQSVHLPTHERSLK